MRHALILPGAVAAKFAHGLVLAAERGEKAPMHIAQVAPLYESVPPRLYGGTERVVHFLTEELLRRGHRVTLFASADSASPAVLAPQCEVALRQDPRCTDPLARHLLMMEEVQRRQREFDVVHFHTDYLHFPVARRLTVPHLTTWHNRLDSRDVARIFAEYDDLPVVSLSNSHRRPLSGGRWLGTVYNGFPADCLTFDGSRSERDYFAFVGRVSKEKGLDKAIQIAISLGVKLRIAAKIGDDDREYFNQFITPLLSHPLVEFVGEIGDAQKAAFMGKARALLFPIIWPEPFGMVLIESMACGTPVVAFRCGAVPEIVEHGISGFVVDDVDDAIEFASRIEELDRRKVRMAFERRFTSARMATDYLNLYERLAPTVDTAVPRSLRRSRTAA